MVTIRADGRAIEAAPDPEGVREFAAKAALYLDLRIGLAEMLLRFERGGTHHLHECSSIIQFAQRFAIPAAEARMLVELARALEAPETGVPDAGEAARLPSPSLEERVRAGDVPVENAALVGRLHAKPGLVQPGEDWLTKAATLPTHLLRQQVNRRIEEAAQGEVRLVPITVHVTERTRDGFFRARSLASRETGELLTEGQTLALLVSRYLDEADERRRGAGRRRVGPTGDLRGDRYVPRSVRREVLQRSDDRCEVPGCTFRIFLELAHVEAHADGGSREAENLLRLCHTHHVLLDADRLGFLGWRDGRPVFRNASGGELRAQARAAEPSSETPQGAYDEPPESGTEERPDQVCERPPPDWGVPHRSRPPLRGWSDPGFAASDREVARFRMVEHHG